MRSTKAPGFSFGEALISITIVGIISVAAFYNLRSARMTDELRTASRVLAADLRSAQSRALQGENIKWCLDSMGDNIVCENGTALCADPATCTAQPAGGFGVHFYKNSDTYDVYSIYTTEATDWRRTQIGENLLIRALPRSGAANVTIIGLQSAISYDEVDVAFQRQNGNMKINACSSCTEASYLNVQLRHNTSLKVITVSLNRLTGRISIEE
jgi:type II secretory pathway pseudopilin PulG